MMRKAVKKLLIEGIVWAVFFIVFGLNIFLTAKRIRDGYFESAFLIIASGINFALMIALLSGLVISRFLSWGKGLK